MKEPRTVELKETRLLLAVLAQAVSEYTEGYAEASDERRRELWARMVDVERKAWEYIRVHPETS